MKCTERNKCDAKFIRRFLLMDAINTAQKRRKRVTHLTTGKKTRKRLPIPDEIQGTAEKICQVSPLKVETKLLQTTEIEKKKRVIFD